MYVYDVTLWNVTVEKKYTISQDIFVCIKSFLV
jgi:hypothetical protein